MASIAKAAYFDEWIAMDDRHNGNLLFNGDDFILIDHETAIPLDYLQTKLV